MRFWSTRATVPLTGSRVRLVLQAPSPSQLEQESSPRFRLIDVLLGNAASRIKRGTCTCIHCRGKGASSCPGCSVSALGRWHAAFAGGRQLSLISSMQYCAGTSKIKYQVQRSSAQRCIPVRCPPCGSPPCQPHQRATALSSLAMAPPA